MKTTGGEREVLKLILFLKDQSFSVMGVAYLIKKVHTLQNDNRQQRNYMKWENTTANVEKPNFKKNFNLKLITVYTVCKG